MLSVSPTSWLPKTVNISLILSYQGLFLLPQIQSPILAYPKNKYLHERDIIFWYDFLFLFTYST